MKKSYLSLLLLLLTAGTLRASHFAGGELRYEYTGTGNTYKIILNLYKSCEANSANLMPTANVAIAGCGVTFTRSLSMTSLDTLKDMYCATVLSSCYNPSSFWPGIIVASYSDTITLAPCTSWKMAFTECCRSSNIANIVSPSSNNTHLEAFLNNSAAINSSNWLPNLPPFLIGVNSAQSVPLYGMDAEGDSVSYSFITPMQSGTSNITYATGYSQTNPMGGNSAAVINNGNKSMHLLGTMLGNYALAMRTNEYRNGQLVGYSSRDWRITVLNGASTKLPFPTNPGNMLVTTCPGQSHSVSLSFIDSVATDSIYVAFQPPSNGITYTTAYAPGTPSGSGTISWTTPATLNPATTPFFVIKVFVRNNACPRGSAYYGILVRTAPCNADSVWAGDANGDKTVNVYDPLAIAIANGLTGPARPGASTAWAAQACPNWSGSFLNGVNHKHADCDGNGTVNSTDLAAVTANYGLTHPKPGYTSHAKTAGIPDLFFDVTGINAYPGATVSIPIKLGDAVSPMNNIYGLAGRVRMTGIMPGNLAISYPLSWLGTAANTIRFTKSLSASTIDWAYARGNQQNTSGQGTLANLTFTIPAGTPVAQPIQLSFEDMMLIDAGGNEITAYNNLVAVLNLTPTAVGSVASPVLAAAVVPNPSYESGVLQLSLRHQLQLGITVTDIAGRVVWQTTKTMASGPQQVVLPAHLLQSGVYTIRISGEGLAKPEVLKWVKG